MPDASQPPIIALAQGGDPTVTGGFTLGNPASLLTGPASLVSGTVSGDLGFTVTLDAPRSFSIINFKNLIADPTAPLLVTVPDGHGGTTILANTTAMPTGMSLAQWAAIGRQNILIVPRTTASEINVSIGGSQASGVQLGYLGISGSWQAPIGMAYNWSIEIEDLSDKQRVPFGTTYVTIRPSSGQKLRILHMAFDYLRQGSPYGEDSEQVFQAGGPFELAMTAGQATPVIGIPFPGDPNLVNLLSVTGYINQQQQFTNPFFATWSTTFSIEEMV